MLYYDILAEDIIIANKLDLAVAVPYFSCFSDTYSPYIEVSKCLNV